MALFAGNAAADLNIATLQIPANLNTNTGSAALDVSNYLGVIAVTLAAGNGATNTAFQANLTTGNDTNISNSVSVSGTTFTNVTTSASVQTLGVDTRQLRKYLYLNWLISGTGANVTAGAIVVGQAKYKGGTGA